MSVSQDMAYGSVPVSFPRLGDEFLDINLVRDHRSIVEKSTN